MKPDNGAGIRPGRDGRPGAAGGGMAAGGERKPASGSAGPGGPAAGAGRDAAAPLPPAAPGPRWRRVGLVLALVVLLVDQISKAWILYGLDLPAKRSIAVLPCLNFTMVWNYAVTFGMFGGHGRWLFIVISALAVLGLLAVLARSRRRLVSLACGGIIGGAIGNVIDRLRYGAVVDFLHFHLGNWSWYVFNIADSAIVCGVGVWLLDSFLVERRGRHG